MWLSPSMDRGKKGDGCLTGVPYRCLPLVLISGCDSLFRIPRKRDVLSFTPTSRHPFLVFFTALPSHSQRKASPSDFCPLWSFIGYVPLLRVSLPHFFLDKCSSALLSVGDSFIFQLGVSAAVLNPAAFFFHVPETCNPFPSVPFFSALFSFFHIILESGDGTTRPI